MYVRHVELVIGRGRLNPLDAAREKANCPVLANDGEGTVWLPLFADAARLESDVEEMGHSTSMTVVYRLAIVCSIDEIKRNGH